MSASCSLIMLSAKLFPTRPRRIHLALRYVITNLALAGDESPAFCIGLAYARPQQRALFIVESGAAESHRLEGASLEELYFDPSLKRRRN